MHLRRLVCTAATALVVACGTLPSALRAQEATKPIAIVSLAPLDRLLADTSYMLRACNVPEMGGLVTLMANQYTQGLDRTKPIGVTVSLEGQVPSAVIFMPMTNRDQFFGALAGMGIEPDDLGDGLFEIDANGQTIFAKDTGGWMFVAQTENALANVPANPAAMLDNLPDRYDLAIRLNVQALPQNVKDMITEQMRIGFERGMAEQTGQTEAERENAKQMGEASIQQLEDLIANTEQVIFGWAVDSAGQKTYIDSGARFVAGSKLAKQAEAAANVTSDYTAFELPAASAKFRFSGLVVESDKALAKNNFRNSMTQVENQLEQVDDMPEQARAMLKELLHGLTSIMEKTIDEGIFDGGGSVSVADDTLRLLVGGRIADGNALAAEFKKAVAQFPEGPDVPKVEFDYDTYQGVTLHRAMIPVKIADPGAKKVFGDELRLTIGTADKGFLLTLDPSGDAAMRAAIDRMSTAKGVKASPVAGVIQLTPLLRFAQAVSPNSVLDNVIATISEYAGKDKIEIKGNVIPRGAVYQLSIEEGVLRSIGAAAKSGGNGGGF